MGSVGHNGGLEGARQQKRHQMYREHTQRKEEQLNTRGVSTYQSTVAEWTDKGWNGQAGMRPHAASPWGQCSAALSCCMHAAPSRGVQLHCAVGFGLQGAALSRSRRRLPLAAWP